MEVDDPTLQYCGLMFVAFHSTCVHGHSIFERSEYIDVILVTVQLVSSTTCILGDGLHSR